MISDRFPSCIPPQMKILNMIIPILMHFYILYQNGALQATKSHIIQQYDIINDFKLFPTVYHRIYCQIFLCYPIRCHITKSSALELLFAYNKVSFSHVKAHMYSSYCFFILKAPTKCHPLNSPAAYIYNHYR